MDGWGKYKQREESRRRVKGDFDIRHSVVDILMFCLAVAIIPKIKNYQKIKINANRCIHKNEHRGAA
jgi:hypothetical protein